MADQPSSHSGSRWEPVPGSEPTPHEPTPGRPSTYEPIADNVAPDETVPVAAARDGRSRLRVRAALAGAATALALGGGLAGIAISHAAGGDDGFRPADSSQQSPSSLDRHGDDEGGDDGGLRQPPPQLGGSSGPSTSGTGPEADPA